MKNRLVIAIGLSLVLPASFALGDLRISEFLASNINSLDDEELKSPDWIEIENTGDSEVALNGYFLTDNPGNLDMWAFPEDVSVKAGERIVVFASGKDQHTELSIFERAKPIKPTHTNFRLTTEGEYLALVEPDGETIVHEYAEAYPRQVANISYGIDEDGELGYFTTPTPGEANGSSVPIGPFITEVVNLTGQPDVESTEAMVITAEIEEHESPVSQVTLIHRFMFKSEATKEMKDDGVAPDEAAGDGVYTASFELSSLFGPQIKAGEMVRWRIEAEDEQGNVMRDPLFHDENNADEYYGTVALDPSLATTNLEVFHWFIENPNAANSDTGTKASVFYLGEFYDNIHVDIHGQSTRGFPKKSWDFDFNSAKRFRYAEDAELVKDINMLTNWADKAKVRNTMAYEMYNMGGVPAHWAFPVRIQQNGEFLGTWDMVEDGDDIYTERVGLDGDGALYKMYNRLDAIGSSDPFAQNGAEKKTRRYEEKEDVEALIDGISTGSTSDKIDYIYDNIDIASTVNFLVMNSVINNTDYGHKNYYVYRDTEGTGEWTQLPWDVDLSLGRRWIGSHNYFYDPIQTTHSPIEGHVHGNRMAELFMSHNTFNDMIYRRLRTMYDYFYGPPGGEPESDYMLRRLDELVELIDPEGVVSDADLDYEKGLADMERKFNETNGWDNMDTMREAVARMRDEYIPGRRDYIYGLSKLPEAQKPYDQFKLGVEAVEFMPASGDQMEEYLVIKNSTGGLVDLSNFKITGAIEHTIKPGTVLTSGTIFSPDLGNLYIVRDARAFRARAESPKGGEQLYVQGNYGGQLSSRGETIQILDPDGNVVTEHVYEGDPSEAQQFLRITELMYNPSAGDAGSPYRRKDYEYIELANTGTASLDLTGISLIDGVAYDFEEGTELAPGGVLLLVSNRAAFESRYGGDQPVAGEFTGNLSNGGERIVLRDARDENVLAFRYDEDWFPEADQEGHSLEVIDAAQDYKQWDIAEGWQASAEAGGTPGSLEDSGSVTPPVGMTYAAWQASHFSAAELADAGISGPQSDANGDGMVNLLAYAFNIGPYDQPLLPDVEMSPADLSVSFIQHQNAEDLVYRVEVSEDLETWTETGAVDPEPEPGEDNTQRVTIKVTPLDGAQAKYVRVTVELTP